MLYNMQSFVEPILAKVLTHCPETHPAVGGGVKHSSLLGLLSEVLK